MKNLIKVLVMILTFTSLSAHTAFAGERIIGSIEEPEKMLTIWEPDSNEVFNCAQYSTFPEDLPPITILRRGKIIKGAFSYPNYDSSTLGNRSVTWIFTPEDASIEVVTGTVNVNIVAPYIELAEDPTAPSLTATTVKLAAFTAYDINLVDKVSGSSYNWTSSDTGVVEVNSNSGLLKAKKEGTATVACDVVYPDTTTDTLSTLVVVGYDENAPLLTETSLDLETGDVFDINLENKVAKSKYRWVSSNKAVAIVNSANGKVTAVSAGNAYVTCTITTPEKQVIVLRCDISVTTPTATTE